MSKRVIFHSVNDSEEDGTRTLESARQINRVPKKTGVLAARTGADRRPVERENTPFGGSRSWLPLDPFELTCRAGEGLHRL
jgi:hypothetical protein